MTAKQRVVIIPRDQPEEGKDGYERIDFETGASILRGLGEQSPTLQKVGVDGLVIWVTCF